MLRFSKGMIPRGSLSWREKHRKTTHYTTHYATDNCFNITQGFEFVLVTNFNASMAPQATKTDATVEFSQSWHTDTKTYCGVFKVIQAVVCKDEPSPFPGLHPSPWNTRTVTSLRERRTTGTWEVQLEGIVVHNLFACLQLVRLIVANFTTTYLQQCC